MQLIEQEIAALPEPQQREVYDFARFLRVKTKDDDFEGLLASETVLAREWDTPEEDAAWAACNRRPGGAAVSANQPANLQTGKRRQFNCICR